MLLVHQGTTPLPGSSAWAALPVSEQERAYADYAALNEMPGVTAGLPLGVPADATTVRHVDGEAVTTPGPVVGP